MNPLRDLCNRAPYMGRVPGKRLEWFRPAVWVSLSHSLVLALQPAPPGALAGMLQIFAVALTLLLMPFLAHATPHALVK